MAVKYSILTDVELNTKNIQQKLNKQVKDLKLNLKVTGKKDLDDASKSMEKLGSTTADTLLTFQAANEIFHKSIDVISSMVEQVFELDTALTEFKKISDLNGKALDDYVAKLGAMGSNVARTASEMVDASTEFRKNGFNDEDAAQLAQVSATFQNVADEAVSAGDAASFLISQMIAFDIPAEKASMIADMVNSVSNAFSVSSADISKALNVVSASSSAMGNSLSETIGLIKNQVN